MNFFIRLNLLIILIISIIGCAGINQVSPQIPGNNKTDNKVTESQKNTSESKKETEQKSFIQKVKTIEISQKNITLEINKTIQLSSTVMLESGEQNSAVEWSSSDPSVASVNSSGIVNALSKGSVAIIASSVLDKTAFAECILTVTDIETDKPTVIEISSSTGQNVLFEKSTLKLTGIVKYVNGSFDSNISWKSSDESIAKIDNEGIVTSFRKGVATIIATSNKNNSVVSNYEISVLERIFASPTPVPTPVSLPPANPPPPPVTVSNIKITLLENLTIKTGEVIILNSTVNMSNGTTNSDVTWSSSDFSMAAVDSTGKVSAIKAGKVTITSISNKDFTKKDSVIFSIIPSDIPEMIFVQGGTFKMGNLKHSIPERNITLSSFYAGKYEVTQKEYQAITGTNPSYFRNFRDDNLPVDNISWFDAIKYCNGLSISQGLPVAYNEITGELFDESGKVTNDTTKVKGYRLLTEAEWEFAAKGGKNFPDYEFSGSDSLEKVGWYRGISYERTRNVGIKIANSLGFHDMTGNVSEWITDSELNTSGNDNEINPYKYFQGKDKIQRGGSWDNNSSELSVTTSVSFDPVFFKKTTGFRVGRSSGLASPVPIASNTSVKINIPSDFSLKTGETILLTASLTPSGSVSDLEWITSDPTLATVDSSGKVTAINEGSVKITVFYKGDSSKYDSVGLNIIPSSTLIMNVSKQFFIKSNPNGIWSYGYTETKGGNFIFFGNYSLSNLTFAHNDPRAPFCSIFYNPFDVTVYPADVIKIDSEKLAFHPGSNGEYAIIRWTAQESGDYHFDVKFKGISEGYNLIVPVTSTEVFLLKGTTQIFGSFINLNGNGNEKSFLTELNLKKGDYIDFGVGDGGNGNKNDSTEINIVIQKK